MLLLKALKPWSYIRWSIEKLSYRFWNCRQYIHEEVWIYAKHIYWQYALNALKVCLITNLVESKIILFGESKHVFNCLHFKKVWVKRWNNVCSIYLSCVVRLYKTLICLFCVVRLYKTLTYLFCVVRLYKTLIYLLCVVRLYNQH